MASTRTSTSPSFTTGLFVLTLRLWHALASNPCRRLWTDTCCLPHSAARFLCHRAEVRQAATARHVQPQRPLCLQRAPRNPGCQHGGALCQVSLNGSPEGRSVTAGFARLLPILAVEIYAGHPQVGLHSRRPCQTPETSATSTRLANVAQGLSTKILQLSLRTSATATAH